MSGMRNKSLDEISEARSPIISQQFALHPDRASSYNQQEDTALE